MNSGNLLLKRLKACFGSNLGEAMKFFLCHMRTH
jgi:hypothetical protein